MGMPRPPRIDLPGVPCHVYTRGNNRGDCFFGDRDRVLYLRYLDEAARANRCAIHAYVLMTNHVHLLVTPQTPDGLAKLMQSVGRRYVRYFNDRQARTGTLWEGRYKSTLIQTESYLLVCMAYIDLNPVRAGLTVNARDYLWSSHAHYIGLRSDPLVSPHPMYWNLGNTPFAREAAYADWVAAGVDREKQTAMTQATLQGWALGDQDFLDELQVKTRRRVHKASAGRPNTKK